MKTLSIVALLFLLTNCAGGKTSKIFFGEKCTQADAKQVQESSLIWFVSKDSLDTFHKTVNKENCLKG